ncbi:MAG: hypothetical protein A3J29_07395 [Acidobacteria bacterium RIFCSPLOWO2_12_FULL_67_14b]|nr:MAG: hypothetical protein A3J29_07395 [Acidobacteria bacterium RIFCSPLOWO2_12_FULL_67_14b]
MENVNVIIDRTGMRITTVRVFALVAVAALTTLAAVAAQDRPSSRPSLHPPIRRSPSSVPGSTSSAST